MRPYWMHRTNRIHRLAMWLGCENGKDAIALIAVGALFGFLLAEAAR